MASETKRTPVALTANWQDLCLAYGDIANVDVLVVAKGTSVAIVWGGNTAPSDSDAFVPLAPNESFRGNADHIWVKGTGTVVVHVEG